MSIFRILKIDILWVKYTVKERIGGVGGYAAYTFFDTVAFKPAYRSATPSAGYD